jgi:hypothetical protein
MTTSGAEGYEVDGSRHIEMGYVAPPDFQVSGIPRVDWFEPVRVSICRGFMTHRVHFEVADAQAKACATLELLPRAYSSRLSAQLLEQRLGIRQIGQLEPFCKTVTDMVEHCARLISAIGIA